jgi:hypothetical protein
LGFCSGAPSSAVNQMRDGNGAFRGGGPGGSSPYITQRNQRASDAVPGET